MMMLGDGWMILIAASISSSLCFTTVFPSNFNIETKWLGGYVMLCWLVSK